MGNCCCAKPELMDPSTTKASDIATTKLGNESHMDLHTHTPIYLDLHVFTKFLNDTGSAKRKENIRKLKVLFGFRIHFKVYKMVKEHQ